MKTRNEKTGKSVNEHFIKTRLLRYSLLLLSIAQAYWPALMVGAATVTAATMFGDKANLTLLTNEIEAMVAEDKPQETIRFLKMKINDHHQRSENHPVETERTFSTLPYLYFYLAKVQEVVGVDFKEIVANYKKSISFKNNSVGKQPLIAALLWLYKNTSEKEYVETIQKNLTVRFDNIRLIVRAFEASKNWPAFELFLDSVISGVNDPLSWANVIYQGLQTNGLWREKFLNYARSKPVLAEYYCQQYEKTNAQPYIEQEDYRKAVEIYREIAGFFGTNQGKAKYEYKICQTLFRDGQYQKTIVELDQFIENNKSRDRILVEQAFLLKGQSYIHLGHVDQAINTFVTLMVEYPDAKQAAEANFFVGYSYMLQGKFELASKSFTLVMQDYPKSSYAGKASLCITRIKNMGE